MIQLRLAWGIEVARAMAALWPSFSPDAANFTQGTFRCATQLVPRGVEAPRLIAEWGAAVQDGRISVEASDEYGGQVCCEGGLDPSSDWWRIALAAQCMVTWSAAVLPPWPKPFDVPIRTDDGTPYVQGAEIPEPARTAFGRNMYHSCRPVIAGEGPCYYAWDWRSFHNGLR
ncbi:hypothetical protein GPA27_03515 [Aromatoleum toluolicum]|uniref:Uncharacterized protein n=1 Tax=Aromatoleum toluolicum TaxID=90060 RepID=A0ABX1NB58_9RHOO|nr:hypothetical protein [Aromatoleum toluolicum]NMF96460.1 hypothetical protein [Aromatoleum toluolicum]